MSSDERRKESKKIVQNEGMLRWQQIQDREVFARQSKTRSFVPMHFL